MNPHNLGIEFDEKYISKVYLNLSAIKKRAAEFAARRTVKKDFQVAWLLRAITCIDLNTLAGVDTSSNVQRLCYKADNPVRGDLLKHLGFDREGLTCGAVCVYPSRVSDAVGSQASIKKNIPVASVATGFPSGQYDLQTRLQEIRFCVAHGASEIDIVINRTAALEGKWKVVYDEIKAMKEACGKAHMKSILAVGELGTLENVYKASFVAMMAGSDFIKISTGKEDVNANLVHALVMVRAIRDYQRLTGFKVGFKVGFKPDGGIRTAKDSCVWTSLMKEEPQMSHVDAKNTTNPSASIQPSKASAATRLISILIKILFVLFLSLATFVQPTRARFTLDGVGVDDDGAEVIRIDDDPSEKKDSLHEGFQTILNRNWRLVAYFISLFVGILIFLLCKMKAWQVVLATVLLAIILAFVLLYLSFLF